MRNDRPFKSDLRRIMGAGATLMVMAYLLDSIINAGGVGESVFQQILSPDARGLAVRLAYLSVLLLFIAYVSDLMLRRKGLEEALVKYQVGMDASIDGIFLIDDQRKCRYLNESQARLHGYGSHAEVQGGSWRLFYDDDEIRRFEEEVFPVLFEKGEWRGEATGRRKDGTTFPQEISFTALKSGGTVCIVRDATEHKRFERELERRAEELSEANGELEAFGYSLTHDMRNHLTRIYSAAQILRLDYGEALDAKGRYLLDAVCSANEEMDRLIEDMMVLSRISRSELRRQEVDLSELAAGIAATLKETDPQRSAVFDIAPGLLAECDPQLVRIALDNLLGNAWKYTAKTGAARIEVGASGTGSDGGRVFFVRDNGVGFKAQESDQLFLPFQRLSSAKGFPGTGVGLATVQRIVQRHGGEIRGEGEPGRGATFFFTLPTPEIVTP